MGYNWGWAIGEQWRFGQFISNQSREQNLQWEDLSNNWHQWASSIACISDGNGDRQYYGHPDDSSYNTVYGSLNC